jgi:hypothetical protein
MGGGGSVPEFLDEDTARQIAGNSSWNKAVFDSLAEDGKIPRDKWELAVKVHLNENSARLEQMKPDQKATDISRMATATVNFNAKSATASTTVLLRGGVSMPIIGLGGGLFGADAEDAVVSALEVGYRLIDTAPKYGGSEAAIGRAIARSEVDRSDIFLASKVGNNGYKAAMR